MVAHLAHLTAWPMGESTTGWWFFPTHLKNMLVKWESSPIFGVKIKNISNHHLDNLGNNTFPVALLDIDDSSAFMPF